MANTSALPPAVRISARVMLLASMVLSTATCFDVFDPGGVADITFVYEGDTVLVVGSRIAPLFSITANGERVTDARIAISSSDDGVITPGTGDSLTASGYGSAIVTLSLVSSLFPDSAPSIEVRFRTVPDTVIASTPQDTLTSLGDTVLVAVSAYDLDGNMILGLQPDWFSLDDAVATVDPSGHTVAVGNGSTTIGAVVGSDTAAVPIVVSQRLAGLAFSTPEVLLTSIGEAAQVTLQGHDARGNPIAATTALWTSKNPGVVTVSPSAGTGTTVTARGNGETRVVATATPVVDSLSVRVDQVATSLSITAPEGLAIDALGGAIQLVATSTDDRGNLVLDDQPSWASLNPSVAVVSALGEVTGMGIGVATVTATVDDAVDSATVVVSNDPSTVEVFPDAATLKSVDDTLLLTFEAHNSRGVLIGDAVISWTTVDTLVIDLSEEGVAVAIGTGTARLVGSVGVIADTAVVTVTNEPAVLQLSLDVDTATSIGDTIVVPAVITNTRGAALGRDAVSWSSSATDVVRVTAEGLAIATGVGEASLWISSGLLADTMAFVVTNTPASVALDSDLDTLTAAGQQFSYGAEVLNGRGIAIAGVQIDWTSSAPAIVDVDSDGLVTALGFGEATIVAQSGSIADTAIVVVLNPTMLHVDNGASRPLRAGTLKRPFVRIQDAVDAADAGDSILVHRGIGKYAEAVVLTRQATLLGDSTDFVLSLDPGDLPVIGHDSGVVGILAHTGAPQTIRYLSLVHTLDGPAIDADGTSIEVSHFFINPGLGTRIGRGILLNNAANARIHDSFVGNVRGYGVLVRNSSGVRLESDSIAAIDSIANVARGAGVRITGGNGSLVGQTVFIGTQGPAIQADSATNVTITGNSFAGARNHVLAFDLAGQGNQVTDNVFAMDFISSDVLPDPASPPAALSIRDAAHVIATGNSFAQSATGVATDAVSVMGAILDIGQSEFSGGRRVLDANRSTISLEDVVIDSVRGGVVLGDSATLTIGNTNFAVAVADSGCVTAVGAGLMVTVTGTAFIDCHGSGGHAILFDSPDGRLVVTQAEFSSVSAASGAIDFTGRAIEYADNVATGAGPVAVANNGVRAALEIDADTAIVSDSRFDSYQHDTGPGGLGVFAAIDITLPPTGFGAVDRNQISFNSIGLRYRGDQSATWQSSTNDIYDNQVYGVYQVDNGFTLVMEDNWWGDANGARKNSGSPGLGDFIFPSNRVDANPSNSTPFRQGSPAARVRIVGGDGQTGAVNTQLAEQLTVRALDQDGSPVPGAQVTFTVSAGDGLLVGGVTETVVVSDSDGLAAASFTLGPNPGTNTVTASVASGGQGSVTFSSTGT